MSLEEIFLRQWIVAAPGSANFDLNQCGNVALPMPCPPHETALCVFRLRPWVKSRHFVRSKTCPLWVKSRHLQCKTACPLYPRKRTSAERFNDLPKPYRFLRAGTMPIIPILLALRRATACAVHSAHTISDKSKIAPRLCVLRGERNLRTKNCAPSSGRLSDCIRGLFWLRPSPRSWQRTGQGRQRRNKLPRAASLAFALMVIPPSSSVCGRKPMCRRNRARLAPPATSRCRCMVFRLQ